MTSPGERITHVNAPDDKLASGAPATDVPAPAAGQPMQPMGPKKKREKPGKSGAQERQEARAKQAEASEGKEYETPALRPMVRQKREKKLPEFLSISPEGEIKHVNIDPNFTWSREQINTYFRRDAANEVKIKGLRDQYKAKMIRDFRILRDALTAVAGEVPSSRRTLALRAGELVSKWTNEFESNNSADDNERRMMVFWAYLAANRYVPNPDISQEKRAKGGVYESRVAHAQNLVGADIDRICKEFSSPKDGGKPHFAPGIIEYITNSDAFKGDSITESEIRAISDKKVNPYVKYEEVKVEKPAKPKRQKDESALATAEPEVTQEQRRAEIQLERSRTFNAAVTALLGLEGTIAEVIKLGLLDDTPDALQELKYLQPRVTSALSNRALIPMLPDDEKWIAMRKTIDAEKALSAEFKAFSGGDATEEQQ